MDKVIKIIELFLFVAMVMIPLIILMTRHGILPSWNPKDYEDKSESESKKKE